MSSAAKTIHRRRHLTFAALLVPVAVAGLALPTPSNSAKPWRDPSGLLVMSEAPDSSLPADLGDTFALAKRIAEENWLDFGYPRVDGEASVVLPVTSLRTRDIALTSGSAQVAVLKTYNRQRVESPNLPELEPDETLALDSPDVLSAFSSGSLTAVVGEETFREAIDLRHSVLEVAAAKGYDEADAWMSKIDARSGRILLWMTRLTPDLAQRLVEAFGADSIVIIEEPREYSSVLSGGRQADEGPYYGGARVTGLHTTPDDYNAFCSSGFAWVSGATYPMLSAGHCAPWGDPTVKTPMSPPDMGEIDASTRENWTYQVGTVAFTGSSVKRGDLSLIRVTGGQQSWARMYRGASNSTTYNTVKEVWFRRALPDDQFCTGGQVSGEICGWVVQDTDYEWEYNTDGIVTPVVIGYRASGSCTTHGDSGGPVFTVRPDGYIAAKGIISGGTHQGGVAPCKVIFTDIYDPIAAFPGTVKLG